MAVFREDPYGNAQFRVEIEGIAESRFEQVQLPELGVEVVEYRDGNDPERSVRKLPGRSYLSNLILRRGYTGTLELYQWWRQVAQGDVDARRSVVVTLLDEERNPVTRWVFHSAFPARHLFSQLDAMDGSTLVETVDLAFDSASMD
jgi:phage tail-like protein